MPGQQTFKPHPGPLEPIPCRTSEETPIMPSNLFGRGAGINRAADDVARNTERAERREAALQADSPRHRAARAAGDREIGLTRPPRQPNR